MKSPVEVVQTLFSSRTAPGKPSSPVQKQPLCPARALCLGCDGDINCSLARLAVAEPAKASH